MTRRTAQFVVLVSALVAGAAVFLPWANWVGMVGVLESSHRGNSLSLGSVPTFLTLVAAFVLFGASLIALLLPHSEPAELGIGGVELAAAVLAIIPPILLLGQLGNPDHWIPAATAGMGLWIGLVAGVAAGVGAVIVLVLAAREQRGQRPSAQSEV